MSAVPQHEAAHPSSALTLRYLLAARQHELQGMRELAQTSELVSQVGQLVHALQKERGQATLLLTRPSPEQQAHWAAQASQAGDDEQALRARLCRELGALQAPRKTRWLHASAHALHGLDGLPAFRQQLAAGQVLPAQAMSTYSRVVGSLLGVVIEALEGPADPPITQLLVALLNFMQAKELCGQERAQGAAGFALGQFDAERQAQLASLGQAQARSFDLFCQHAPTPLRSRWQDLSADELALQRLRQLAATPGAALDSSLARLWFDVCTARIDALHGIEQALADALATRCRERMRETEAALQALALATEQAEQAEQLAQCGDATSPEKASAAASGAGRHAAQTRQTGQYASSPPDFSQSLVYTLVGRPMDATVTGDVIGDAMARSVLDVLLAQGARLHEADQALAQARRAQQERRRIEQAKWWLVSRYQLSEAAAHERLQRTAMNGGLTLLEVAEHILAERPGA